MSSRKTKQLIFLQLLLLLIISVASCNSKTEDTETDIVVTYATVAVKKFYIKANDSVMKNLDSVFFSIDLNSGVIFNSDSLPKGTDVTKLIPSITFSNTMSKAELAFLKDNKTDTVVDYLTNPDDSIDFSKPVLLKVTAADETNTFTYQIKVNVHQQNPDSLIWNKLEMSELPSLAANPKSQKTILWDNTAYTIIEESNSTFSLWSSSDLNEGKWEPMSFNPGFDPIVESFTVSSGVFYLLDNEGELYSSSDLASWTDTAQKWWAIIGAYGDSILGIKLSGNKYYHSQYPSSENYLEQEMDNDFPIINFSSLGHIETKWSSRPMAILMGGLTKEGTPTSAVWAFDGINWAVINQDYLPALESPMLARYVVYRETTSLFIKREFDVWLIFGGYTQEGKMNREMYMSYDNGVTWSLAPEMMQLEDKFPDLYKADIIVAGYPLTADLSEAWTPTDYEENTRSSYTIEGYDITWMCPYMYIFGGYEDLEGKNLNKSIYRGVLERLRFTPQI